MRAAQHWINQGCVHKALAIYSASPVGNPRDNPDLLKALLDLTPYQELPSAADMADVPGTPKFVLQRKVYDKYISSLPPGRAAGTFLTTYELIRATYEAGAQDGWFQYFSAFGAGALVEELADLSCGSLRAIMLNKNPGWRPLGIKQADCRVGAGLYVTQRRTFLNDFYTSELSTDKAKREEKLRAAKDLAHRLEGSVAAVATRNHASTCAARLALANANIEVERLSAPPNYPVQLCYAPLGADLAVHALEGFHALAPDNDTLSLDTKNMYNEADRAASFKEMNTHDPMSKPIYRMVYGRTVTIHIARSASGSTVVMSITDVMGRSDRLGIDDPSLIDPDDPLGSFEKGLTDDILPAIFLELARTSPEATDALLLLWLISTRGFHQGCALATHGACIAYHVTLHRIAPDFPTTQVVCFGDDTYGNDDGAVLYEWRAAKTAACEPLGHVARVDKEACWSPASGCTHAPACIPGSPLHPGGLLLGFKALGAFLGDDEWCRHKLRAKLFSRLDHLDRIDAMADADDVTNADQIRQTMLSFTTTSVTVYSMRCQTAAVIAGAFVDPAISPDGAAAPAGTAHAHSVADAVDARTAQSFEALALSADSPSDCREGALAQMRLPVAMGGLGWLSVAVMHSAARTASRLGTASRLAEWFPIFRARDPLTDPHPWFADVRTAYESIRAIHACLRATYAAFDGRKHHLCDGSTVLTAFRPLRLPEAKSLPPISSVLKSNGTASVRKPPKQGMLASVLHHQEWGRCLAHWQAWDAAHPDSPVADRATANFIAECQKGAGGWLSIRPADMRVRSSEFRFALQRRFSLHLSDAAPVFAAAAAAGDPFDPFGDRLLGDSRCDRSAPHTAALRELYAAHEATAPGPVVYGDKECGDTYRLFNETCCLDIGERGQAPGGRDFIVELKVWAHLHPTTSSVPNRDIRPCPATHGFGATLEHAIWRVVGVKARSGENRWDHTTGTGSVAPHAGDYDDAQRVKRNRLALFLMETTGAFSPPAYSHLRWLKARSKTRDRTHYTGWAASARPGTKPFMMHWARRISTAAVSGNARRGLNAISALAVRYSHPS